MADGSSIDAFVTAAKHGDIDHVRTCLSEYPEVLNSKGSKVLSIIHVF